MKKLWDIAITVILLLSLVGCGGRDSDADESCSPVGPSVAEGTEETAPEGQVDEMQSEQTEGNGLEVEEMSILMKIGEETVAVIWEENESVAALVELLREQPMSMQMSMYGGFEQVGSFGTSLPRDDEQTTTQAGDIVLYSGNQMVVFYGSNSWAYTRLGRITDKSAEELEELLGNRDVTITLELVS